MWLLRISLARPQTINRNKRRSIYRSRVLVLMMNPFASNTIHAHLLSIRPPARDSRGPLDVQPNVVLFPGPHVSGRRPFRAPFLKYRTGHNYGYAGMRKVTSNIGQVARSGKADDPFLNSVGQYLASCCGPAIQRPTAEKYPCPATIHDFYSGVLSTCYRCEAASSTPRKCVDAPVR